MNDHQKFQAEMQAISDGYTEIYNKLQSGAIDGKEARRLWKPLDQRCKAAKDQVRVLRAEARLGARLHRLAGITRKNGEAWREVLAVGNDATIDQVEHAYKILRSRHHPDKGGNPEMFKAVQAAWAKARVALGGIK